MPKIIKNGKEYSGVPIEVVTAWAPTADPVQVKEPLMGNTDISNIGDGTVTGAIDELKSGLTNASTGTITTPRSGVTLTNATCYKVGDIATVSGKLTGSTTASGTFFNIPEGFRPRYGTYVIGYLTVNNVYIPLDFAISPAGVVTVGYSSSQTATAVFFNATYHV